MRILVFKPSSLGDSFLAFPALAALRARNADATIEWAGRDDALQVAKALGLADAPYSGATADMRVYFGGLSLAAQQKLRQQGLQILVSGSVRQDGPYAALQYLSLFPGAENTTAQPAGVAPGDQVAILVGTEDPFRQYQHWRQLEGTGRQFVVLGYDAAATLAKAMAVALHGEAVTDSLLACSQALARCRAFVGLEAALTHLAWGMGKRGIILARPELPSALRPPDCQVLPLNTSSEALKGAIWQL